MYPNDLDASSVEFDAAQARATYAVECSRCNGSTPLSIENDLYVCRRCGYRPVPTDQFHKVLKATLETAIMVGRPETFETLRMDQWQGFQFVSQYFRSGGVYDQVPSLEPEAPAHIQRLWEVIQRCQDEVPELYDEEA